MKKILYSFTLLAGIVLISGCIKKKGTCSDNIQNQGETMVDCGGPCSPCGTCVDGIQNRGETGIDCGGPCPVCATCSDGIKNQVRPASIAGGLVEMLAR